MAHFRERTLLKTLLIIAEGEHELAFLNHIKMLYVTRSQNLKVRIESGQGVSPEHLLDHTARRKSIFDNAILILDTDREWPRNFKQLAKKAGIRLIGLEPLCFDGFLLNVLGQTVSKTSHECKTKLQRILKTSPSQKESYAKHFPRKLLQENTQRLRLLN